MFAPAPAHAPAPALSLCDHHIVSSDGMKVPPPPLDVAVHLAVVKLATAMLLTNLLCASESSTVAYVTQFCCNG